MEFFQDSLVKVRRKKENVTSVNQLIKLQNNPQLTSTQEQLLVLEKMAR
jgi:hypothetical protein